MSPNTAELLGSLLPDVYGAVTDSAGWARLCVQLHNCTGASAKLFGHAIGSFDSRGIIGAGFEDGALDSYHQYFGNLNPWMHMNVAMKPGDVGISDQALDRRNLFQTEFYNDWLRPAGDFVTGAAMICQNSDEHFVGMALACPRRQADDLLMPVVSLLEALSPHVTRAIELSQALGGGAGLEIARTMVDASHHAMFVIARSGRVAHANRPADTIVRQGEPVTISQNGRLRAVAPELQTGLQQAIMAMQSAKPSTLPAPIGFTSRMFGQCAMHSHFLPEDQSAAFPNGLWSDPVVGIVVIAGPAGPGPAADYDALARSAGATPAEARLANAICAGKSVNDYADQHALSRHTVRNQLRALMHKIGAATQADLVRRLMKLASPFS